jgi:hypothetical protein
MTPAEELLAAIKEHATAEVNFQFEGGAYPMLGMRGHGAVVFGRSNGVWFEDVYAKAAEKGSTHTHSSASSAVYSAFLRARAKHPPAADSAEEIDNGT